MPDSGNPQSYDRFGVKEILTMFVLPELHKKADRSTVVDLEHDVRRLEQMVLSPEKVASMIGQALEKKEARGWTSKERGIAVVMLLFSLVGAVLGIVQLAVILGG